MTPNPRHDSLRDYLQVIRQHRWMVLLVTLLGTGLALGLSIAADPVYEAEASLEFRDPGQGVEFLGLPAVQEATPEQRAAVGAEQANRREVLDAVRKRLKLQKSTRDLADDVDADAEVRTNLVVIQARDRSAEQAARIADAMADEIVKRERRAQRRRYSQIITATRREMRQLRGRDPVTRLQRRELEQRLVQLRAIRDFTEPVQLAEFATAPRSPISPKPVRNTALGFAGGLLLGIMLAFLRSALDRKLRGAQEIIEAAELPLLAVVRREALGTSLVDPHRAGKQDRDPDLEAFRVLRTNLGYLAVDRPLKTVLVTSSLPDEGKSTVASSLAVATAFAGKRTLLIGCDLRRPVLAERMGFEPTPGLTDFLGGHATPQEVVRYVALGRNDDMNGDGPSPGAASLAVIPAGSSVPWPAELLGSKRFEDFVRNVSDVYDLVVFDSAPLLSVGDTLDLVEHVDGIVLCVRSDQTTRDQLRSATAALGRLPHRPTGLVATGISRSTEGEYGYYTYAYASSAART